MRSVSLKAQVVAVLVAAMPASGLAHSPAAAAASPPLPLRKVAQGVTSGIQKPERAIVRSDREWRTLWRRHHPFDKGAPPRVDFGKEQVLAVFAGSRPTGGYAVRITAVREEGGKLLVDVQEQKPKPGAITSQALTAPYCMVAVKKSVLAVSWQSKGNG